MDTLDLQLGPEFVQSLSSSRVEQICWLPPRFAEMPCQPAVFAQGQGSCRTLGFPCDERGGQEQNRLSVRTEFGVHQLRPNVESTSGQTAPLPCSRRSQAATVKVHREPTTSSTSNTGAAGGGLGLIVSEPSRFRACCALLAIDFGSGRGFVCSRTRRKDSPRASASRRAKSGTKCGFRSEGMHATQLGVGSGLQRRASHTQALTSSLPKLPSCCLPTRTI